MNAQEQIREDWALALESGEFEQGHVFLQRADGKNCCLGVLCILAVRAGIIPEPVLKGTHYAFDPKEPSTSVIESTAVRNWAGLVDYGGRHQDVTTRKMTSLVMLNDWEQKSFKEIAAVIRANPEGLFTEAK